MPGLIREKVAQLFKALPKRLRRHLVPPAGARDGVPDRKQDRGSGSRIEAVSREALARYVQRAAGEPVSAGRLGRRGVAAAPPDELPRGGRGGARARDGARPRGAQGAAGAGRAAHLRHAPSTGIEKRGITRVGFRRAAGGDRVHPRRAQADRLSRRWWTRATASPSGSSTRRAAADAAMRAGVRRLMRLALKEQMKQLEKSLPGFNAGGAAAARARDRRRAARRTWSPRSPTARSSARTSCRATRRRSRRSSSARARGCRRCARRAAACSPPSPRNTSALQQKLAAAARALPQPAADVRAQLARLVYKGFLQRDAVGAPARPAALPQGGASAGSTSIPAIAERDARHAAQHRRAVEALRGARGQGCSAPGSSTRGSRISAGASRSCACRSSRRS